MALTPSWSNLGAVPPTALTETRTRLHAAVQPMAAVAYALGAATEDHSHSNLFWDATGERFLGRSFPDQARAYLDTRAWETGLLDVRGDPSFEVAHDGLSLGAALEHVGSELRKNGRLAGDRSLAMPPYNLPFGPDVSLTRPEPEPLRELGRWFACASHTLASLARSTLGGAELRGWPHHFDLAALHVLDTDESAEEARSVNAGFSPGDGSYEQPYFYVSPWPYPSPDALPELPDGVHWHTEGYTAAILPGERILAVHTDRDAWVASRLRATCAAALRLVGV